MPAAVVTAAKELPLSPFMGGRRPYVKWVWNGIGTVYGQKVSYACKIRLQVPCGAVVKVILMSALAKPVADLSRFG